MLVAGVSLGVFASTLVARSQPTPRPTLDQKIEERVKLYREFYDLDALQTDAIRHELHRQRRALRDLIADLHRRHKDEFGQLVTETEQRIAEILAKAR
jgi:hypothetical protein